MKQWNDKRYYSLDYYLKETFHAKIYKLSLNAGMTCPNRDGTLGIGGCIFCSKGGSGDFASSSLLSITNQIEQAKAQIQGKSRATKFIAYFQAFTNTYAPLDYLTKVYMEALRHPDIIALSIATRPDCLPEPVLDLLTECGRIKPVYVELGLQTIHEETAIQIRRGYSLPVFEQAVCELSNRNIPVITHVILGLPKETKSMIYETICYLNTLPIHGIKLQLLHVLKGTDLQTIYEQDPSRFHIMDFSDYIDTVITCLELLRSDIVIHRITGDGPKDLVIAPSWSTNKRLVLNSINQQLAQRGTYQGRKEKQNAGRSTDAL